MKKFFALHGLVLALLGFAAVAGRSAEPVQFIFRLPPDARNPFARDLWAEVLTPSQKILRLPVFFWGSGQFAVRARAAEVGEYRLGAVTEREAGRFNQLSIAAMEHVRQTVKEAAPLPQVSGYRGKPARFLQDNGEPFVPIGANVPWATKDRVKFHLRALSEFNREGLNWMRIWMAHWGGLNLEWLPPDMGPTPSRGILNLHVAADWDKIVAAAEGKSVYLQIVLQHHGQYSTTVNPNWNEHPWNAANRGGFLANPGEFFTSELAIGLTALKYRYIIARWGYSPAVLAWELFNEVHWTDPINQQHDDSTVARWHEAMATYIRSVDKYHHLVTTSTEDLGSPIYAKIDFYQPHLYGHNVFAATRTFSTSPAKFDRPIFYGEVGDDHMDLTAAQKNAGIAIVPPVWASLMGEGFYAAQPWLGDKLMQTQRLGELGAVARFIKATGLGRRENLTPFSAVVDCDARVPLTVLPAHVWQPRPAPELTLPLDGHEPLEYAGIPRVFAGATDARERGFPAGATYRVDLPREMALQARVAKVSAKGAALRISVDGKTVAEKIWSPPLKDLPTPENPFVLSFRVAAGPHTLAIENPGGSDWFELNAIDFPIEIPVLASVGQRSADFLALWIWHREGVFALKPAAGVEGTVQLPEVPAGTWRVTWWDTIKGIPATPVVIAHPGGLLKLPTPRINRHAAVVLTRAPAP